MVSDPSPALAHAPAESPVGQWRHRVGLPLAGPGTLVDRFVPVPVGLTPVGLQCLALIGGFFALHLTQERRLGLSQLPATSGPEAAHSNVHIAIQREKLMHRCFRYLLPFAAALVCSAAVAQTPIVIKLSHVVSQDTAKGKAALKFKELAEKNTNGKVKVEVFPNSSLFKDAEEIEALQLGTVQMLIPAVAKFGPIGLSDFDVFDLPYMFPDLDGLHRVTQGPIGRSLLDKLANKGIAGLAFWDNSFVMFSANKPLRRPEDVKGSKMRSYSKIIDAQYRALNAIPQTMAFSEVYQGLQTGVIDGQDTVPVNMVTQKLYEVQKFGSLTFHRHPVYAVITNKKWWDGLPADVRKQLEEALAEATRYNNEIAQKENTEAVEVLRKTGKIEIYQPTPAELDAWRKALLPVHKQMESRIPRDLYQAIEKEAHGTK